MLNFIEREKCVFQLLSTFIKHASILLLIMFVLNDDAEAQLSNVPVTGFNNDIVAGGVGTNSILGTTNPSIGMDGALYTFIDNTFKYTSANALPTCFMPVSNLAASAQTPGLTYQFQPYGVGAALSNNALTVVSPVTSGVYASPYPTAGTLTLSTPASYGKLFVLYETVVNTGTPSITATVTFTDLTTQVFSGNTVVNWFTATLPAYSGMGRTTPAGAIQCGATPNMFELQLPLSVSNYSKLVQSISFTFAAAAGTTASTINYFHAMAVGSQAPCAGTPAPGNTIASVNPICSGVNFTLSLQNATGAGATYQWQSSPDGTTWTNVAGGTNPTLTTSQTAATYYQSVVTCTAGPSTGTSNPLLVTTSSPSACYCTFTNTSSASYYINNFSTTGGIANITNNGSGFTAGGYGNFTAMVAQQIQGSSINFSIAPPSSTYGFAVWVDWNQNGSFADAGEQVYNSGAYVASVNSSFTVPLTAITGNTRMRVVTSFSASSPTACGTFTSAECEDYTFNVVLLTPCVTPTAQPTSPLLTAISTSQINGGFTAAAGSPSGYLVVRYPTGSAETLPSNGTIYIAGNALGLGTVIQASASTSFSNTGLSGGTAYDYYVYSYNNLCGGAPFYLTTGGFFGSQSTNSCSAMSGVVPVGPTAPASPAGFPTLSGAGGALAYIITNGLGGNTALELQADYTSAYAAANETYPLTFSSNPCINSSKTLTIRPAAGVPSVITLTSANSTLATVVLDGASYITFDGRNGGTGSNQYLSIVNTSTASAASGNAVLLKNDANNNTLTYLDVQSANGNAAANTAVVTAGAIPGAIAIGTTSGANGNDNNTISFCNIHSTGTAILGAGIYAGNGTTAGNAANNDNNTITGNNIYDFFLAAAASAGIDIAVGNNSFNVTNNRVYQTATRTYTGTQGVRAFWITPNTASLTSASGYVITGNIIGYNSAVGTGTCTMTGSTAWLYLAMDISVGTGAATSVQGNTITNISMTSASTSTAAFVGINIANGNVNIGTSTPNLIGSTTTNGAITYTTTGNLGGLMGIRTGAGTTINISNNIISGIDLAGSATITPGFNGINGGGGTTVNITNNTVGSTTLVNSINAISAYTGTSAQVIRGIFVNAGTTSTVTGNTIANVNSNVTATGSAANTVVGIAVSIGSSTVSGNTITNLTSQSQSTSSGATCAVVGIAYTSTTAPATISGNTIHTLKLSNPGLTVGAQIAGIVVNGPTSGTNTVSKNNLHSFSLSNAANTAVTFTGITVAAGTATYANNMVRLGFDELGNSITAGIQLRGITKGIALVNNFYHNSVYIGGTNVISSALNSFAFQRSTAPTAANDDIKNNIFVNNRSNASTGGKHYVFAAPVNTFLTLNHNDYYFNGTGGLFALNVAADVALYTAGWIASDITSQVGDPQFINPTGTAITGDLHIHPANQTVIEQNGISIAAVTDDFDGQSRASNTPDDIGADAGNFAGFFCAGSPASATAFLTVPAVVCGPVSKVVNLSGFSPIPGYTYQWQESVTGTGGSFVNVTSGTGGTSSSFTTAALNSSMYYQCIIGCSFGGSPVTSSSVQAVVNSSPIMSVTPVTGTNVCSGANIDLSASGASTYSWSVNPGVTGYPVSSLLSTPNNTGTVTSRPTSTLSSSTVNPPATVATPTWTYTVTGTSANGCTSSSVIVLNVITTPVVPIQLTYTSAPDPVCAPGTPVTFTVTNPGTIGAGNWTYNWYDQTGTTLLQSTTNTSSTDTYTPATPVLNGNYIYKVKVSNTVCPASYAVASPTYFVGYTSLNNVTNANCGDNGLVKVYPEGQTNFTTWYSNSFATGLLGPAFDASFGNTNFTGGLCNITPMLTSQTGALVIRNSGAVNTNNLQVDFKMSTAPRGFAFNILGADGMCWSYGSDVTVGTVTTGGQGEGGSGTGLKLAFDATNNGLNNLPGAYLMFNCTVVGQGPGDPGVLAYKLGSWWQGLVNAPVSIVISQNGFVTVTINNEVIFDHVALPASYLTSNKSNWIHSFTARTGGSNELHAIDDLNIRYNAYEYSNNSTTGLDGTWQSSNTFSALAAGSYPIWVRNPSNTSCFSNTGTAVVGTSASPSSAMPVAASGFNTTICAGSSTDLTTDVSIPGATFLWETASSVGGPYSPATGTNNTGTYSTGSLLANAYYRCTFTCPSSSPITSTPVLVTVNSGSIASTNSPQTINCIGSAATLTATPGANTTCVWYAAASGGSPLFSGDSYVATPAILPATYYVEPVTTLFTNHYDFGGEKSLGGNINGGSIGGVSIASHFNTSASIRIDSIKVLPNATGTLTVALQNASSATNILTFNQVITAAQVGNFVNVPVNFAVAGSGNYQLTTSGISCSYNNFYPIANYTNSYMNMGGVFTIVGGSSTPTGANSTSIYGTAYNWSITTSCPTGGARVPVVVNANPTYFVSVTPASTSNLCATAIQALTASSPNAYSSYTWSPVAKLYSDAAATIPLTLTDNQAIVYFKAPTAGSNTFTVSTAGSGCTNTANATVNVISAPNVILTATPNSVCLGGNIQLNAAVNSASPYCTATGGAGTYYVNNFSTTGGVTNITNNGSGFSPAGYNYFSSMNVTQAVGSSVSFSVSNFSVGTYGVAVFVDWNKNGLFTDAGDQVYASGVSYVSSAAGSFTVPAGAYNGNTRMRVVVDYLNTAPGACDVSTSHETEDYDFIVTGGIVPGGYTFDWSTNPTFLSATNISNPVAQAITSDQTYSVIVSPLTGCSAMQTTIITVKALPAIITAGGGVICEGNAINLSADNIEPGQATGNTYSWSTNAPTPFTSTQQAPSVTGSSTVNNSGNYTVVVTNSFLCTSSAIEVVTVNPNPTLSIVSTQNVGCAGGSDGSITVGATGGLANYDFTSDFVNFINDPAQGTITNLPTGSTTIFVSDANGCNSQISASLTAISTVPPSAAVVVPFIGMPTNVCNGTTATLSIPAVSNTTMYIWDAPGAAYFNGNPLNVSPFTTSTPSVTVTYSTPGGSLYVTGVQAANGCGASLRKVQKTRGTISVPAIVSGSTTACANTTGTYSTGAVDAASSYQWTITGDATVSGTGTTATVTFGPAWNGGTLCVAAQTSCYTSPAKCITLSKSASTLNAISGAFTACPNTTLSYSVPPSTGAASYTWTLPAGSTGSSTTNSISVTYGPGYSAAGSICVSVTSVCGVTSAIKCKTVAPGLPGQPSSITGALAGLCNQTVAYSCPSQGAGVTYNWTSPGSITSGQGSTSISTTFAALSTGNVCVTASNSCGSSLARCVPVKGAPNAPGAITATPSSWCANTPGIEFNVSTGSLTGSYTLSWAYPNASVVTYAFGGGNSTSLILDWISGSGAVNVTASNACGGATKPSTWSSTCREGETGTVSSMVVSPNPTTGVVNVNYTATKGSTVINVLDLAGRVVMTQNTNSVEGANTTQLDMSKLAKGAYMLSVQSTQGNKQIKVVVE